MLEREAAIILANNAEDLRVSLASSWKQTSMTIVRLGSALQWRALPAQNDGNERSKGRGGVVHQWAFNVRNKLGKQSAGKALQLSAEASETTPSLLVLNKQCGLV